MPPGLVHDRTPVILAKPRQRRRPRPHRAARVAAVLAIRARRPHVVLAAEVGELGGLKEEDAGGEDGVDVGEDAVQVDDARVEAEGGV